MKCKGKQQVNANKESNASNKDKCVCNKVSVGVFGQTPSPIQ
jgi:hypothetical protein